MTIKKYMTIFAVTCTLVITCVVSNRSSPEVVNAPSDVAPEPYEQPKWTNVIGINACASCHEQETESLKLSPHWNSWFDIRNRKKSDIISKNMSVKFGLKKADICHNCHYSSHQVNQSILSVSGISCEKCHGPAKEWIGSHRDSADRTSLANAGMIIHQNAYVMASTCYSCHALSNEELVNIGGHQSNSAFDLVAWSRGQHGEPMQPDDVRKMFVVGAVVRAEHALRSLAQVTVEGRYKKSAQAEVLKAYDAIDLINNELGLQELDKVISLLASEDGEPVKITNLNIDDMISVIEEQGKSLNRYSGSDWKAIDSLIPHGLDRQDD